MTNLLACGVLLPCCQLALEWCLLVQESLLWQDWPAPLLDKTSRNSELPLGSAGLGNGAGTRSLKLYAQPPQQPGPGTTAAALGGEQSTAAVLLDGAAVGDAFSRRSLPAQDGPPVGGKPVLFRGAKIK
jgi:hypothetical protein